MLWLTIWIQRWHEVEAVATLSPRTIGAVMAEAQKFPSGIGVVTLQSVQKVQRQ
jgi:hypothetical protein